MFSPFCFFVSLFFPLNIATNSDPSSQMLQFLFIIGAFCVLGYRPLSFLWGDPPFRHLFTFLCQGCKSIPAFGETRLRPLLEEIASINQFSSTSERLGMEIGVSGVKLSETIGHSETAEMVVETLRHQPFVFLFWMLLTVGYGVANDVVTDYLVSSFMGKYSLAPPFLPSE
jgi:hypothetical protein